MSTLRLRPTVAAAVLLWAATPAVLAQDMAGADDEAPPFPSAAWTQREAENFARSGEAIAEQLSQPAFQQRWTAQSAANIASYSARAAQDPSWLLATSTPVLELLQSVSDPAALLPGVSDVVQQLASAPLESGAVSLNLPLLPLCTTWALPCTGDPFRYPEADAFYENEAEVAPVVFYDRDCARLSGRVWKPRDADTDRLPGIVIMNGSVQAPEPLYWWAAQALVRAGYTVLSFDPRGQGRSDFQTPSGGQGTNINLAVFWEGLVDGIDFFRSRPDAPYPHNARCASRYPTPTTPFNPFHAQQDRDRLGLAGHSAGAIGVSVVQSYDGEATGPWPGLLDDTNPVDVVVAWDGLLGPDSVQIGGALGDGVDRVPKPLKEVFFDTALVRGAPPITPRVPAMGQSSEYGLLPVPFTTPPNPAQHLDAFSSWQTADVPVVEFTIAGSTHFEWSLLPGFPATSWCPEIDDAGCSGGWGMPMARHYTVAWFDRWLKQPGEAGYDDADSRLLAEARFHDRFSVYYRSARDFATRSGDIARCEDLRLGCDAAQRPAETAAGGAAASGALSPVLFWMVALGALGVRGLRRRRHAVPTPTP